MCFDICRLKWRTITNLCRENLKPTNRKIRKYAFSFVQRYSSSYIPQAYRNLKFDLRLNISVNSLNDDYALDSVVKAVSTLINQYNYNDHEANV